MQIKKGMKDISNTYKNRKQPLKPPDHLQKYRSKVKRGSQYSKKQLRKMSKAKREKDPNFKQNLRKKFIEVAKSYVGVPYAKKHRKPDDPYYYSPIFLDCCGLVRRVVKDLQTDFGFRLAMLNQNYQMDVCPVKLTFEQLQPGDLIFYRATYFENYPKKKYQRHDLTHVEIFLGGETGTMSVASRRAKGVVTVFDDFRFKSKNYGKIQYNYRSLDTWLNGVLISDCDIHLGKQIKLKPPQYKYQQHKAQNTSQNQDQDQIKSLQTTEESKQNTTPCSDTKLFGYSIATVAQNSCNVQEYFENKPNYVSIVHEYIEPQIYWVRSKRIRYKNIPFKKCLINNIPNVARVFCKKHSLGFLLKNNKRELLRRYDLSWKNFFPQTFRLDVLKDLKDFIECGDQGKWIKKGFYKNHLLNIWNVEKYRYRLFHQNQHKLFHFYDQKGLFAEENCLKIKTRIKIFNKQGTRSTITGKFSRMSQLQLTEQPYANDKGQRINLKSLIQKSIEKQLLINNQKFQLSCIVLIASACPLIVLYHSAYIKFSKKTRQHRVVKKIKSVTKRLASPKRRKSPVRGRSPKIKKVNVTFQERVELLINGKKEQKKSRKVQPENEILTADDFLNYFSKENKVKADNVLKRIKKILGATFSCAVGQFGQKNDIYKGCYKLLRCNFIITQGFQPFLIKMTEDIPERLVYKDLRNKGKKVSFTQKVIKDTLDLMLWIQQNKKNYEEFKTLTTDQKEWSLLFNESNQFSYGIGNRK